MKIRLAAPSCVYPDRLGPNCQALASEVGEIALMLLETQGCLAYDHRDLPPDLPNLGLRYHAHLPVDLPWHQGVPAVAAQVQELCSRIAFLHPWGYVLHPPAPEALEELLRTCPHLAAHLLIENTKHNNLAPVWPVIERYNLGVCLDTGHLHSYGQYTMLKLPHFFSRVRLMHIYGGETRAGHLGLDSLENPAWLRDIMLELGRDCVAVVELFSPPVFLHSLALLRSWLDAWGIAHD